MRRQLAALAGQSGPAAIPVVQPPFRPAAYPVRRAARTLTADLPPLADPGRACVERLAALSPALATARDPAPRFGALIRLAP